MLYGHLSMYVRVCGFRVCVVQPAQRVRVVWMCMRACVCLCVRVSVCVCLCVCVNECASMVGSCMESISK